MISDKLYILTGVVQARIREQARPAYQLRKGWCLWQLGFKGEFVTLILVASLGSNEKLKSDGHKSTTLKSYHRYNSIKYPTSGSWSRSKKGFLF